ncbi:MAG: translation elongation factor Ts [Bacteroidales bacterium]|nr:translation elongation factor Ts [Bacteroidales bacterium]MDD7724767.1 translation elongation factor Ts [Bacteroidales bacterium]MDY4175671.1 translation elongation factor Ts [Bacteroidales bacterium]
MAITAQDVKKLRDLTNAGMMDCKKALTEANGDFDRARDILRERGQLVAAKRADREAKDGVAIAKVSEDGKHAAAIILNAETDFVAANDKFLTLAASILDLAISAKPADLEALKALELNGHTVAENVNELTGVIGEKIDLSAYQQIDAESIACYVHNKKIAAVVGFNEAIDAEAGKKVAMQVATMAPVAIDKSSVSQETIDHELEVGKEMARNEGKPENMLEKIAQGRLAKFFKESTLMEQAFFAGDGDESKLSVGQYLASVSKTVKPVAMIRLSLA